MDGYILYRDPLGTPTRSEDHRSSQKALRRALEKAVPAGRTVLGIVFGPQEQALLRALPRAS